MWEIDCKSVLLPVMIFQETDESPSSSHPQKHLKTENSSGGMVPRLAVPSSQLTRRPILQNVIPFSQQKCFFFLLFSKIVIGIYLLEPLRIHVTSSLTGLPKETLGKLVLELFSVLHMTTACSSICVRVWGLLLTTLQSIELSFLVSSLLFTKALRMCASKETQCLSVCRSIYRLLLQSILFFICLVPKVSN